MNLKLITLSSFFIYLNLYGQTSEQDSSPPITIYGGVHSNTIETSDFNNFHISDWETYGLKSESSSSAEGRLNVPLADKDPGGSNLNLLLGAISQVSNNLDGLAEVQVGLGDLTYVSLYVGANYKLINSGKFSLGITPKVGYTSATADFGAIELISNYTAPVIIDEGRFTNGDSLTMDLSGAGIQLGITPSIKINNSLGLYLQAGYDLSFASKPVIKVNEEIEIPMNSNAVVRTDLTGTQADLSPDAKIGGLLFQLGITYNLE